MWSVPSHCCRLPLATGRTIGQHFNNAEIGYKVAGLFKRGVLVSGTLNSAHTVRIEPPLVITYEHAMLDRLADTLAEIQRGM